MKDTMKGLRLTVARPAGYPDCTRNGVSAKNDLLTLVGTKRDGEAIEPVPWDCQVFDVTDEAPAVVLVQSYLRGAIPHLEPYEVAGRHRTMFGGNLATGDSRLGYLVVELFDGPPCVPAISIHDRIES